MKTWTPIFDELVPVVGLIPAAVYGRMWRFSQGDRKCCQATHARIAQDLGCSVRTVIRAQKLLCKRGYVVDKTPDLRNRPHTYSINGVTESHTTVTLSHTGVTESHGTMTESHTQSDRESHEETIKRQDQETKEETTNNTAPRADDYEVPSLLAQHYPELELTETQTNGLMALLEGNCTTADQLSGALNWARMREIVDPVRIGKAAMGWDKNRDNGHGSRAPPGGRQPENQAFLDELLSMAQEDP